MTNAKRILNCCVALLACVAASLCASAFQYDIYFDGASEKTLTFGLAETALEKPMPPDFAAVKYAYLQGGGSGDTVQVATDYTKLSMQIFEDAVAATWTLNAKSDIELTFKGSAPANSYLRIREDDDVAPVYIADGTVFSVRAGESYCIQYGETRAVVPIPEAPENVETTYLAGATSVAVELDDPDEDGFDIAIDADSVKAFAADGETRNCSVTRIDDDDFRVSITADTASFKFNYYFVSDSGVKTRSALVTGTATTMAFTLDDVTTSSESSDVDEDQKQATVRPGGTPVKVTLKYNYSLSTTLANPYLIVNTGTEAYAATAVSATVNGKAATLAKQESGYDYKTALAAGKGTFSVSLDVDKAMERHTISLLCGADGLEAATEATFDILIAGFSLDFDENGAIALDDANYLLNYRNGTAMLKYATAAATEDDAEDAEENIIASSSLTDFDSNGTADKTDALMFYNYMALGGSNNQVFPATALLPSGTTGADYSKAMAYFRDAVAPLAIADSAAGILTLKGGNFILGASSSATFQIYAKSSSAIQSMSFQVRLPKEALMFSQVTLADISAQAFKYVETTDDDGTLLLDFAIVGAQGAKTIAANKETLLATVTMTIEDEELKEGDSMAIVADYAFATCVNGTKVAVCEATDVATGAIPVIKSIPATITANTNPKTPIVEVSGKNGTSVNAGIDAVVNTTGQTDAALKSETITKIHWAVKNANGEVLKEAWANAKGGWDDEACTVKQAKAVAGTWYISASKAGVNSKTGKWTSKVKVTTAAFNTLAGADREKSGKFTLVASAIDSMGGSSDYSWTIDITDQDQLAAAPTAIQYSVNGGALVDKLGTITAGDTVTAYAKAKSGKTIVDAPVVDADGDAVTYYYAWYTASKATDDDWKTAEEGGNVLPAHCNGQTWKLEVKALAKPAYAADEADTTYFSKSLKGSNVKIANTAPAANAIARTIDEDGKLVVDLLGEGYVTDLDQPAETFTFAVLNAKNKGVVSMTTAFGGQVAIDKTTGILTYTACGKKGTDSFTYTATDKGKKTASALVTIALEEVNDAPSFAVKDFYLTADEYTQSHDIAIYPGPDYEDEADQSITAATVALVNESDAEYFTAVPAVTAPVKAAGAQWTSTLTFALSDAVPLGIEIPCVATATDSEGAISTVSFSIVTGVTPWYPIHKAVFTAFAADGITFKVKQVLNGVVQKKILATVSVPKNDDGECILTPALYYAANAKFTGLAAGQTYFFEEYSYTLNNKGKAKIDSKCISGCTSTVADTCETILAYTAPAADDCTMEYVSQTADKKGRITYTFKIGAKLANSLIVKTLNAKGKAAKTIKQNFVNFDEDGCMVQKADVQLSLDNIVSVSVCGVNPAGTGAEKIFSVDDLKAQADDATRAVVDDMLQAWPSQWADNAFFPKQGAVVFTEEAAQNVAFTWPECAAASGFELNVYDAQGALAASAKTLLSTADLELAPGNYSWIVTAFDGEDAVASYGNTFSIVDHTAEPVVMDVTTAGDGLVLKVVNAAAGDDVAFALTYFDAVEGIWTATAVSAQVEDGGIVRIGDVSVFAESYITIQFADGTIANYVVRGK